jgi:hypothetical protein
MTMPGSTKISNLWIVNYQGEFLLVLSSRSHRWIGETWEQEWHYEGMKAITKHNRPYFDQLVEELITQIRTARTNKQPTATVQIDNTRL